MRKHMIILQMSILMVLFGLSRQCTADNNVSLQVTTKPVKIDPADMEVIQNLDLLQDWDIVGPEGPDMKKMNLLNALPLKGVSHVK